MNLLEERNDILRKKLDISQEITFVFSTYNGIIREIIAAYQTGMPFIPFSDYERRLDANMFVEERSEEIKGIVASLKTDLSELAKTLHYTHEDINGFFY